MVVLHLAKVIHCRVQTVLAAFKLKISKLRSVHFRGLTKTFQSFYFEFPISAAQQEAIFRTCASHRWQVKNYNFGILICLRWVCSLDNLTSVNPII